MRALDADGCPVAIATFDGPAGCDWVELRLELAPGRPDVATASEVVRRAVELARQSGAARLVARFDPDRAVPNAVLTATQLGWQLRVDSTTAQAELEISPVTRDVESVTPPPD